MGIEVSSQHQPIKDDPAIDLGIALAFDLDKDMEVACANEFCAVLFVEIGG